MRVNIGTAAFPRWRECQREEDYKDLCTWALKKEKVSLTKVFVLPWPRHHHNFPSKMVSEVSRKSQYKAELYQAINMLFNAVKFEVF